MEKRTIKRLVIGFGYLLLVFLISFVGFNLIKPKATCTDGIKNQLEAGIDCGGPCAPCEEEISIKDLEIKDVEWVDTANDNFDAVVTVKNPNSLLGVSTIKYRLKYFDEKNKLVKETRWLDDFILPEEEKYFLVQEIGVPDSFTRIEVEFGDIVWKKFTAQQQKPRLEVILTELSNSFEQDPSGFYRVKGTLINESSLDCEAIKIKVVLRSGSGKLLTTNSQVINTVHSKEKRDFNIPFNSDYNMEKVEKVEIKPETNIFDSENHIRFYGITESE